jgi:hypothetical protein
MNEPVKARAGLLSLMQFARRQKVARNLQAVR